MTMLWKRMSVAVMAAVMAVLVVGGLVLARPAAAAENQAGLAAVVAHGGGGRGGYYSEAGQAAAAEALDMTVDDLTTQLQAGESLADLAETAGVDLQTVLDAITAANVQATRDAIAEAVTEGTITQAQADWLSEGLDAGYWGPGATGTFGFGPRGFGDFGGRGHGLPGDTTPATATPSSGT
jgi:hypothetical protein